MILYDTSKFSIALINSSKLYKDDRCQFNAVNIRNYDMILKLCWLKKINLNIQ